MCTFKFVHIILVFVIEHVLSNRLTRRLATSEDSEISMENVQWFGEQLESQNDMLLVYARNTTFQGSTWQHSVYIFVAGTFNHRLDNLQAGEAFGASIAMDGPHLCIGARRHNYDDGAAYCWHEQFSGHPNFTLQSEVIRELDRFGSKLSLNGNVLVVGATGLSSGTSFHIFEFSSASGWTLCLNEPPWSSSYAYEGYTSDVDGDFVIVGFTGGYQARIYSRTASCSWNANQTLLLSSADIAGIDVVAITRMFVFIGGGSQYYQSGVAVYKRSTTTSPFSFHQLLSGATGSYFGQSLATSGELLLVGATQALNSVGVATGSCFVYIRNVSSDLWVLRDQLFHSNGTAGDEFGTFVSIDQSVQMGYISAPYAGISGDGRVYSFNLSTYFAESQTQQPTLSPTDIPSRGPTNSPTQVPSDAPTSNTTKAPTSSPSQTPTDTPTKSPTSIPTSAPSRAPTNPPSQSPTSRPTGSPSFGPTGAPTKSPSNVPTPVPTASPLASALTQSPTTSAPSRSPSQAPTNAPSNAPTRAPTRNPTHSPTALPTTQPTRSPSQMPSKTPSGAPTSNPTRSPTIRPTTQPTGSPTQMPTKAPSGAPTSHPTLSPTTGPPTRTPSLPPTGTPTASPSAADVLVESGLVIEVADSSTEGFNVLSLITQQSERDVYETAFEEAFESEAGVDDVEVIITHVNDEPVRGSRRRLQLQSSVRFTVDVIVEKQDANAIDDVLTNSKEGLKTSIGSFLGDSISVVNLERVGEDPLNCDYQSDIVNQLSPLLFGAIGGLTVVCLLAGYFCAICKGFENFHAKSIIVFGFLVLDFITDVFFSVELLNLSSTDLSCPNNGPYIRLLAFGSVISLVSAYAVNLAQMIVFQRKWQNDPLIAQTISSWFSRFSVFLVMGTLLTGSTFASVHLFNSNLLGIRLFHMGLSSQNLRQFHVHRLFSSVLLETLPQLAIQFLFIIQSDTAPSLLAIAAFVFSAMSLLGTVVNQIVDQISLCNTKEQWLVINMSGTVLRKQYKRYRCKTKTVAQCVAFAMKVRPDVVAVNDISETMDGIGIMFCLVLPKVEKHNHQQRKQEFPGRFQKEFATTFGFDYQMIETLSLDVPDGHEEGNMNQVQQGREFDYNLQSQQDRQRPSAPMAYPSEPVGRESMTYMQQGQSVENELDPSVAKSSQVMSVGQEQELDYPQESTRPEVTFYQRPSSHLENQPVPVESVEELEQVDEDQVEGENPEFTHT